MKRRLKVHKEGYAILFSLLTLLVVTNVIVFIESPNRILSVVCLIISVLAYSFFLYFFRNPTREIEINDENLVIAPADGHIVVTEPTEEWEYFDGKKMIQVSIFMNVFSVHANWYPIAGKILHSSHQKGRYMAAYLPKSSTENERSLVVIETPNKVQVAVRQIAGAMARRIVTYAKAGKQAHRNEHLGFIKFGSRVDMYLPLDTEIFVAMGEHVRGNETIIGRINS